MTNAEARAWAERFWQSAGVHDSFPRSLERAVSWAVPLAIVKLPSLRLSELRTWLRNKGLRVEFRGPDRSLRACLIAKHGRGVVILDGTDPEADCRFSLAHEVAHFLLDYLHPRERASEALGPSCVDVLDGLRVATVEERFAGILKGVTLDTHVHLLERSAAGQIDRMSVLDAEDRSDRLALELLAPRNIVLQRLEAAGIRWQATSALRRTEELLIDDFGLPSGIAENYARFLVSARRSSSTFREWLGA